MSSTNANAADNSTERIEDLQGNLIFVFLVAEKEEYPEHLKGARSRFVAYLGRAGAQTLVRCEYSSSWRRSTRPSSRAAQGGVGSTPDLESALRSLRLVHIVQWSADRDARELMDNEAGPSARSRQGAHE